MNHHKDLAILLNELQLQSAKHEAQNKVPSPPRIRGGKGLGGSDCGTLTPALSRKRARV
jgi:hypothetical protein